MALTLENRKIDFVKKFLEIEDEEKLSFLESILIDKRKFIPFTVEQLQARADKSMEDIENNKFTSTDDLLKEVEEW